MRLYTRVERLKRIQEEYKSVIDGMQQNWTRVGVGWRCCINKHFNPVEPFDPRHGDGEKRCRPECMPPCTVRHTKSAWPIFTQPRNRCCSGNTRVRRDVVWPECLTVDNRGTHTSLYVWEQHTEHFFDSERPHLSQCEHAINTGA